MHVGTWSDNQKVINHQQSHEAINSHTSALIIRKGNDRSDLYVLFIFTPHLRCILLRVAVSLPVCPFCTAGLYLRRSDIAKSYLVEMLLMSRVTGVAVLDQKIKGQG